MCGPHIMSASSSIFGFLQPPLHHALHTSAPTPPLGDLLPAAGLVSPGKPCLASRGQATAAPSGGPADAAAAPWDGHVVAAAAPSCGQGLIP